MNKMNILMAIIILDFKKIQTKIIKKLGPTVRLCFFVWFFLKITMLIAIQVFILLKMWWSIRRFNDLTVLTLNLRNKSLKTVK
jgi:hypothetical protein